MQQGFVHVIRKRPVREEEDRTGYWLARTPEERVEAVGLINLTIRNEAYAQQEFQRVCRITRGKRG